MRNIFSDTMVKDGLTNSIKTILQKNDINSLQEITKILSEFNLDFKVKDSFSKFEFNSDKC